MDPITLSGTFATLVGLLANYKAERSGSELSEFMIWLREENQDQMAAKIEADKQLSCQLTVLLAIKHEALMVKLGSLTEQISQIANQIEGFSGLAAHFSPASPLSEQAKSLLRQLVLSGAEFAQQISADMGSEYFFVGATSGEQLKISEKRFLNEDIADLESSGLLRIEYSPKGAKKLIPSRIGYSYIKRIES